MPLLPPQVAAPLRLPPPLPAHPPHRGRSRLLASPAAEDRIGRLGTGLGNMPRAISECCVAEQSSLDNLVVRVQHAVRTCASCSVSLRRVHYPNALFLCSVSLRRVYSFCWLLLILESDEMYLISAAVSCWLSPGRPSSEQRRTLPRGTPANIATASELGRHTPTLTCRVTVGGTHIYGTHSGDARGALRYAIVRSYLVGCSTDVGSVETATTWV